MQSKKLNGKWLTILMVSSLSMSACSDSVFEKRLKETEEENKVIVEEREIPLEDLPASEVELSEEQKKALENADIKESAEEAVANSELEKRVEVAIKDIPSKEKYTDVEEFSQFVNALFFAFHTKQIDGKTFYDKLSPHFSEDLIAQLPPKKEQQIQTFELLQSTFTAQIKSQIMKYQITNVEAQARVEEGSAYRKYIQANGKTIYYLSTFVKKDGRWLLMDDSPAPPYSIGTESEPQFNESKGE